MCSFAAAVIGSYYGSIVEQLERDGRVCDVPYDEAVPVTTAWDLGIGDSTAIWFLSRSAGDPLPLITTKRLEWTSVTTFAS